jgi:hypothetical protein
VWSATRRQRVATSRRRREEEEEEGLPVKSGSGAGDFVLCVETRHGGSEKRLSNPVII